MRLSTILAAGALALTLAATGCTDLAAGDSIVASAAVSDGVPASIYGTADSNVGDVVLQGASGTAPCDYIGTRSQQTFDKHHPSTISFSWSGNAWTPCMKSVPYSVAAITAKYRADLTTLTNWWTSKGVRVIYSAPVCRKPGAGWVNGDSAFRTMENSLALSFRKQGKSVTYSDYAARQICPNWVWSATYRDAADPVGLHLNATGAAVYARALRYESKHTAV